MGLADLQPVEQVEVRSQTINIPVPGQLLSCHKTAESSELGVLQIHKVEVFTSEKGGRNGFLLIPRLVRRL